MRLRDHGPAAGASKGQGSAWGRAGQFAGQTDCDCAIFPVPVPRVPVLKSQLVPPPATRPPVPRRCRIWDLGDTLHCSIIGTCLSTDELRRLLRKLGLGSADSSDHALHGAAVGLAGRHDAAAKLLNKALDERHRTAIRRFDAAKDTVAVRGLWQAAKAEGTSPAPTGRR